MNTIAFGVNRPFCGDCMIGLRRFIQGLDGIASVQIAGQIMSISFDPLILKEKL